MTSYQFLKEHNTVGNVMKSRFKFTAHWHVLVAQDTTTDGIQVKNDP